MMYPDWIPWRVGARGVRETHSIAARWGFESIRRRVFLTIRDKLPAIPRGVYWRIRQCFPIRRCGGESFDGGATNERNATPIIATGYRGASCFRS